MEKLKPDFNDSVAETLLIPLWMRAKESKRADGLIKDPESERLTEQIDYDFGQYDKDKGSAIGVAIRTRFLDNKADEFISSHEFPVVVLIGCGLDPRFQRLKNKGKAVCYELDIPEVISFRKRLLPETENDEYISSSVFSTQWMDELHDRHKGQPFIFICEGVFMYFDAEDVKGAIRNIAERFPGSELYFERLSPLMCRNSGNHPSVGKTKAVFKWGTTDPAEIEGYAPGIRLKETFYYTDIKNKRWGFMGFVMRNIPFLHKSFGVWGYRID